MTPPTVNVIRCLRSALGSDTDGPTDSALLSRFAMGRDEGAFELIVWRHAGMVLRVCRSILRDHHDAEDASQAVFLALARQAKTVYRQGTVAGWLYRVAWRISAKAKRRRVQHSNVDLDQIPTRVDEPIQDPGFSAILQEELARLPEKYQVPMLLSFFEGLTHADAARRLGWPIGTFATRIARAKERLQRRLSRRGVTLPTAGIVALTTPDPAPAFVATTVRGAVAFAAREPTILGVSDSVLHLAQGAIRTMTISKLHSTAVILAACGTMMVGGVWAVGQFPRTKPANVPDSGTSPGATNASNAALEEHRATSAQRQRSLNNLKRIALAFHNYNEATGHLPGDIQDKDGKALLSWRVAILPYVGQEDLYKQFKLDQPWDSEHNLKLLSKIPTTYLAGIEPEAATHTYYQVFAGPGTPFGPSRFLPAGGGSGSAAGPPGSGPGSGGSGSAAGPPGSGSGGSPGGASAGGPTAGTTPPKEVLSKGFVPVSLNLIPDGTSNTLGVIEAGPSVPWSKPADLPFDANKPLPKLNGPFTNALHVSTLDGNVFAMRRDIDQNVLRALIGMDDGEVTPDFKTLLARRPAETPEEKAALQELVAQNQKMVEECERLLKESVELLGKKNAEVGDFTQAEQQADKLRELIERLKKMNKALRSNSEQDAEPKPISKKPAK